MDSQAGRAAVRALHSRALAATTLTPAQIARLDFSDHSSLTTLILAVSAVSMALIVSIVTMRLVIRRNGVGRFFLDDCQSCLLLAPGASAHPPI